MHIMSTLYLYNCPLTMIHEEKQFKSEPHVNKTQAAKATREKICDDINLIAGQKFCFPSMLKFAGNLYY